MCCDETKAQLETRLHAERAVSQGRDGQQSGIRGSLPPAFGKTQWCSCIYLANVRNSDGDAK